MARSPLRAGSFFFDIQQIHDPLQLLGESPKISADINEIIYDSAWIEALLRNRLARIDTYVDALQAEIDKTD